MQCPSSGGPRINSFALVTYTPDPLGPFLDRLRRELVPSCFAHAHVTILPPREIVCSEDEVVRQLRRSVHEFPPFRVELTGIEVFARTSVIYLGIGRGKNELRRMHDAFNRDALYFDEPHQYHPHVTLAQEISPDQVPALVQVAEKFWSEYRGPRTFELDALTFVQNTKGNQWLDLEEFPLGDPVTA